MIREDILEGLKFALSKKESLKQAMASFYNAGYKKQDIEDSARALQSQNIILKRQVKVFQPKNFSDKGQTIQRISGYGESAQPFQKVTQNVFDYKQKSKGKWKIYLMVLILLILLGILAAVYFFKPQLIDFFENLLG